MFKQKRILVGIDFSPNSVEVFKAMSDLQLETEDQAVLIHVVPDLACQSSRYLKKTEGAGLQKNIDAKAVLLLEKYVQKHGPRHVSVEMVIARGAPAAAILKVARERRVNLIIVGITDGQKPEGNDFGSTAEKVLRGAPCPVLCVPCAGV